MKNLFAFLFLLFALQWQANAQKNLLSLGDPGGPRRFVYGVRAGINISNVAQNGSLETSPKIGFMAGFYADNSIGHFAGMRQEITYSAQGFHYKTPAGRRTVNLQYLLVANLFALNFGNVLQVHLGPQFGYLTNALADTVRSLSSSDAVRFFSVTGQTNRLSVGGCAGFEIYPYKGLLVGARYNVGFSAINKKGSSLVYTNAYNRQYGYGEPSQTTLRSEVWQLTLGWRFGYKQ